MFEQAFNRIDGVLRNEVGCTTELDHRAAKVVIDSRFTSKQQARFLDFVVAHFVRIGVARLQGQMCVIA